MEMLFFFLKKEKTLKNLFCNLEHTTTALAFRAGEGAVADQLLGHTAVTARRHPLPHRCRLDRCVRPGESRDTSASALTILFRVA